MKSKRAREHIKYIIDKYLTKKKKVNLFILESEFEMVCKNAEQDAEKKAVSILEDFIDEGLLLTKEDEIVSKFKQLLIEDKAINVIPQYSNQILIK